ncbi:hypothetical protein CEUSTIGMA_g5549.t1 [Chlamydomonas eustigma]|uniref:Uncharacterized protein n=1 Tax=Chlamydomonas eustigma TaxID=1157962 RepID=A0A250X4U3_9CHLO|nr:hypothetical protein CEUSTIGMA_g5549.t1 [Chlamydomonas eustigma]|eukprot:GAX78107.1 hypothetical protein CEUSTIGMA_g5549.t1 [Chlamydomonas eustigma]
MNRLFQVPEPSMSGYPLSLLEERPARPHLRVDHRNGVNNASQRAPWASDDGSTLYFDVNAVIPLNPRPRRGIGASQESETSAPSAAAAATTSGIRPVTSRSSVGNSSSRRSRRRGSGSARSSAAWSETSSLQVLNEWDMRSNLSSVPSSGHSSLNRVAVHTSTTSNTFLLPFNAQPLVSVYEDIDHICTDSLDGVTGMKNSEDAPWVDLPGSRMSPSTMTQAAPNIRSPLLSRDTSFQSLQSSRPNSGRSIKSLAATVPSVIMRSSAAASVAGIQHPSTAHIQSSHFIRSSLSPRASRLWIVPEGPLKHNSAKPDDDIPRTHQNSPPLMSRMSPLSSLQGHQEHGEGGKRVEREEDQVGTSYAAYHASHTSNELLKDGCEGEIRQPGRGSNDAASMSAARGRVLLHSLSARNAPSVGSSNSKRSLRSILSSVGTVGHFTSVEALREGTMQGFNEQPYVNRQQGQLTVVPERSGGSVAVEAGSTSNITVAERADSGLAALRQRMLLVPSTLWATQRCDGRSQLSQLGAEAPEQVSNKGGPMQCAMPVLHPMDNHPANASQEGAVTEHFSIIEHCEISRWSQESKEQVVDAEAGRTTAVVDVSAPSWRQRGSSTRTSGVHRSSHHRSPLLAQETTATLCVQSSSDADCEDEGSHPDDVFHSRPLLQSYNPNAVAEPASATLPPPTPTVPAVLAPCIRAVVRNESVGSEPDTSSVTIARGLLRVLSSIRDRWIGLHVCVGSS